MPRLLETIKCLDGLALHLPYHQKRLNYSRQKLELYSPLKLALDPPKEGLYRCRVIYEDDIINIQYIPYVQKKIKRFKLTHSQIDYALKYENRNEINELFEKKEEADEIIIVKDDLITDTSISNICVYDGKQWLTPKTPLLNGTTRQRLLDNNTIHLADISYKDMHKFSKIALLNAMIDFHIIENAIIT